MRKETKIFIHCVTGEIHRQVVLHVWSDVHRPHGVSCFEGASVVHHGGLPCFSSVYDLVALTSDVLFAFSIPFLLTKSISAVPCYHNGVPYGL